MSSINPTSSYFTQIKTDLMNKVRQNCERSKQQIPEDFFNNSTLMTLAIVAGDNEALSNILNMDITLIENKDQIDPNLPDKNGITPLFWAIKKTNHKAIELLMQKKVNLNLLYSKIFPPQNSTRQQTTLIAPTTNTQQIPNIHQNHIVPNSQPVYQNIASPRAQPLPALQLKAPVAINQTFQQYNPHPIFSIINENPIDYDRFSNMLLRINNHQCLKDNESNNLLHIAAKKGLLKVAQLVLSGNYNINAITNKAETPLHLAVKHGHLEMVRFLLNNRANVNARNKGGTSPLHIALDNPNEDIIKLLLDNGALVNVHPNGTKCNILETAKSKNIALPIQILLEEKLNVETKRNFNLQLKPLHSTQNNIQQTFQSELTNQTSSTTHALTATSTNTSRLQDSTEQKNKKRKANEINQSLNSDNDLQIIREYSSTSSAADLLCFATSIKQELKEG